MHSQYYQKGDREWRRPGYLGGNILCGGAGIIRFGHCVSGSGRGSFGEREKWACVDMRVQFPEDKDETALKMIYELQKFIDTFLDENGLKIPDDCRDKDYNER